MTMAKKLPLLAPSIHTFEVNGTYKDCEARRTVFMAIQKMVSAGKYYRIPYHGSSKKGYSYKRKDGGLTITLADYPEFKRRYITLSGVNLARIAGDPSRLSLTNLSPEGLAMQEQAFLDELEQLGLLGIEDSVKWKMHRLDITQDFYVKCDPSLMVKIIRYAGSVDPYRKGRALHYNQHNEIRSCKFEKTRYDFALFSGLCVNALTAVVDKSHSVLFIVFPRSVFKEIVQHLTNRCPCRESTQISVRNSFGASIV